MHFLWIALGLLVCLLSALLTRQILAVQGRIEGVELRARGRCWWAAVAQPQLLSGEQLPLLALLLPVACEAHVKTQGSLCFRFAAALHVWMLAVWSHTMGLTAAAVMDLHHSGSFKVQVHVHKQVPQHHDCTVEERAQEHTSAAGPGELMVQ